jgi:hypothetical protein
VFAIPTVQVDLRNGEQFTPAFRAINPDCTVPLLVLDDGATISGRHCDLSLYRGTPSRSIVNGTEGSNRFLGYHHSDY